MFCLQLVFYVFVFSFLLFFTFLLIFCSFSRLLLLFLFFSRFLSPSSYFSLRFHRFIFSFCVSLLLYFLMLCFGLYSFFRFAHYLLFSSLVLVFSCGYYLAMLFFPLFLITLFPHTLCKFSFLVLSLFCSFPLIFSLLFILFLISVPYSFSFFSAYRLAIFCFPFFLCFVLLFTLFLTFSSLYFLLIVPSFSSMHCRLSDPIFPFLFFFTAFLLVFFSSSNPCLLLSRPSSLVHLFNIYCIPWLQL